MSYIGSEGWCRIRILLGSVGDPDLEDPHIFGPPGSVSISQSSDPDLALDPSLFSKVLSGMT
jgi:hypothetical protein